MLKSDMVFNDRLRQVMMVMILVTLFVLFVSQLYFLAPGFLGAVTLYILSRDNYTTLVVKKKWKKGLAAALFLGLFTICIGLPLFFSGWLLVPRIKHFIGNPDVFVQKAEAFSVRIRQSTGFDLLTPDTSKAIIGKIGNMMPELLNNSALVIGNFLLILFLAYFMLTGKEKLEKTITSYIPLKERNIRLIAKETLNMVRSNAIGIPLISLIQALFAMLGYWIFGVEDFVLWGFITGIFAFFPVIGTSLIWIPLCIAHFGSHAGWQAIGLLLYSIIVIGNIDYLARISILKRIGQVHPVITIIGVILGLKLFGFWGFIFGPLLVSYMILLLKIYTNEFGTMDPDEQPEIMHKTKPLKE